MIKNILFIYINIFIYNNFLKLINLQKDMINNY